MIPMPPAMNRNGPVADERERRPRAAHGDPRARREGVDLGRRDADLPHGNAVMVLFGRVAAQRVLPDQAGRQDEVDVRARPPARQRAAVRQAQADDVLGLGFDGFDDQRQVPVHRAHRRPPFPAELRHPAVNTHHTDQSGHQAVGPVAAVEPGGPAERHSAARAAGELARYATACSVFPVSVGWYDFRKYGRISRSS